MAVHTMTRKRDGATVYSAQYNGPEGRRRKELVAVVLAGERKKEHADAEAAARLYANEQRAAVQNGTWTGTKEDRRVAEVASRKSIADALDEYVEVRDNSKHVGYRALAFAKFFKPIRDTLADVTQADAEAYRVHRGRKVADSTLRKDLIFARSVMRWARSRGYADSSPFDSVKLPKEPAPREHYLTHEDEARLVAAIRMPWLRRVVAWLVGTGMDRAEVAALSWSDVNLADGIVHAPRSKSGEPRTVYLTPTLRAVLAECAKVKSASRLVFLDDEGQPVKPARVSLSLRRAYVRAGLPVPKGGPVKILRHTFLTRVQAAYGNLRVTQALAGHADPRTTARYAHVSDSELRDAALAANGGAA